MKGRRERANIMEFMVAFFSQECSPQFKKTAGKWAHTHTHLPHAAWNVPTHSADTAAAFLSNASKNVRCDCKCVKAYSRLVCTTCPPPPPPRGQLHEIFSWPISPNRRKGRLGRTRGGGSMNIQFLNFGRRMILQATAWMFHELGLFLSVVVVGVPPQIKH